MLVRLLQAASTYYTFIDKGERLLIASAPGLQRMRNVKKACWLSITLDFTILQVFKGYAIQSDCKVTHGKMHGNVFEGTWFITPS